VEDRWPDIQAMFNQLQKQADQRFSAEQVALTRMRDDYDKRFDTINELRNQLAEQAQRLLPRAEFDAQHRALIDRIERSKDQSTSIILSVIAMVISAGSIVALVVTHR
jgi:uncharacterized coiled-coil DUF342 family protein